MDSKTSSSNCRNGKRKNNYCYYYTHNDCKNNSNNGGELAMIRKGPWKAEEDQVLVNHVKKYGPHDWSSIRSKGLLLRTGKSCRLRWVNKLRPNLKHGCKFTAEEENVVIELQAQLGNKWATIATHLPGRTDNDVKNFWSSRQKKLARLLDSQSHQTLNKRHKFSATLKDRLHFLEVNTHIKVPKNSSTEGETSSKIQFPVLFSSSLDKNCSSFEANNNPIDLKPVPFECCTKSDLQLEEMSFPLIPNFPTDLVFAPETQELVDRLEPNLPSYFGCCTYNPALDYDADGFRLLSCFDGETRLNLEKDNLVMHDCFSEDFPLDFFDLKEL